MNASPALTLVQYPGIGRGTTLSPPCNKVHMALRYKGLAYETKNVRTPGQVKRYNPRGRVPALVAGDEVIVDSSDILDFLERRFPNPPLEPSDPVLRARCRILEAWAGETIYFQLVYLRWQADEGFEGLKREVLSRMPPPFRWILPVVGRRIARARLAGQGTGLKEPEVVRRELGAALDALAALLTEGPFVLGPDLTRADLALAAILDGLAIERITPREREAIHARPELVAWLGRVHERAPSASPQ